MSRAVPEPWSDAEAQRLQDSVRFAAFGGQAVVAVADPSGLESARDATEQVFPTWTSDGGGNGDGQVIQNLVV